MRPITNVLVPIDFSDASRQALRYACAVAEPLDASLHVLHASLNPYLTPADEFHPLPPGWFEEQERLDRAALARVLTGDEQARYRAVLIQRSGDPATCILEYLNEEPGIDLVVMATHGRGGVARLMLGSVADKVVRAARCPVLTVRAHDEAAGAQAASEGAARTTAIQRESAGARP